MKWIKLILLIPFIGFGQSVSKSLLKANSMLFRNHVYVYGFTKNSNDLNFKIFKFNTKTLASDSSQVLIGKENQDNYLDITADTLHGYLNFYLQKANNKNLASLIRVNDSLKLIAKVENFEANKINSLTTFENEIYTYKNSTYTIRTSEDSLGKQYYLSKYEVISNQKPFEYKYAWQYPLEKRNINTTHVFYADDAVLFMYVNILTGEKKGQWVIKLNSKTGKVIKGIRLNDKTDNRSFIYNTHYYDAKTKQMLVAGNIYSEDQVDLEEKTYTFKNLNKQNTLYFVTIDSLCENITRNEKTFYYVFAVNKPATKEIFQYHFKLKALHKIGENEYVGYGDLYKNLKADLLFLYENGLHINFTLNEMDIEFYSDKLHFNTTGIKNLVNTDVKDINGKIELNSILQFDKFLYKSPITDVEICFGKDDLKNPKWILMKTELNSGMKTFYYVKIGAKGPEQKSILESSKYLHPAIYKTDSDKIILFNSNTETGAFTLSIKFW